MTASPFVLSFVVATLATLLAAIVGVPFAFWVARERSAWSRVLESLALVPLVVPPVVTGYGLLALFSPETGLGRFVTSIGVPVVFHWTGAVLAGAVVSFPLLVRSARAAFETVPPAQREMAATCGASPFRVFQTIDLPWAAAGIAAGCALAFARALGEFGATLIVAGNLPGITQTLPMAIYDAIFSGDYDQANRMVWVVTAVAVVLLLLADRWERRVRGLRREARGR
ncbi:MAG: molybdate ABC transporter permease subunit [Candidatus Eisenbacteria bacterium]